MDAHWPQINTDDTDKSLIRFIRVICGPFPVIDKLKFVGHSQSL